MRIAEAPVNSAVHLAAYFKQAKTQPEIYSEGLQWYKSASNQLAALSETYKVPFPVVCGITARLSPSISWNRNITATSNLLQGRETIDGYSRNVDVARKLLNGDFGSTDCGVSGSFPKTARKTFAFYHNLLRGDKSRHVTIDRWMIRASMDKRTAKELPAEFAIAPRAYADLSKDIAAIGKKYRLPALQVQACIWLAIRVAWRKRAMP